MKTFLFVCLRQFYFKNQASCDYWVLDLQELASLPGQKVIDSLVTVFLLVTEKDV